LRGGEGRTERKEDWCRKRERGRGVYCSDFERRAVLGFCYYDN